MQSLDARWNSIGEQEPVTILSMSGDNDEEGDGDDDLDEGSNLCQYCQYQV